jgi:hypothetical protein
MRRKCRFIALHANSQGGPIVANRQYLVRVLVADGKPGLIPFVYRLPAESRDAAISAVRRNIRQRSGDKHRVRHVDSARLLERIVH